MVRHDMRDSKILDSLKKKKKKKGNIIYIYMERYNKSTMPENAEIYFVTHRGNRTHDLDNTA